VIVVRSEGKFSGTLIAEGEGSHEAWRYLDEQIALALRQAETRTLMEEVGPNHSTLD
jgi:hypothetical protein